MALTLKYKVDIQSNRKVLNIKDDSIGWNTEHYLLNEYYKDNPTNNSARLNIVIETKDKTYNANFVLTKGVGYVAKPNDILVGDAFGTSDNPVIGNDELVWHVLLSFTGNLILVNSLDDYTEDDYDVIPDGIFTIAYSVDSGTTVEATEPSSVEFVVTNGAEKLVEDYANAIADNVLVCNPTNIDNIADYLVKEAMLFAVSKSAYISRKNRILNILSVINK